MVDGRFNPQWPTVEDGPDYGPGFAGDWHANTQWAVSVLNTFARLGITTIYHVGDFGVWDGTEGIQYIEMVNHVANENNQNIYIILGNHENYNIVATMVPNPDPMLGNGWVSLPGYSSLRFAPRGHVWVDHGVRFAAMGGAGSIDKLLRKPGVSWWPEEELTENDCARLVENVVHEEWDRIDVMLTHESPAGVRMVTGENASWMTPEVIYYCWTQRVRLRDAVDAVAPRILIHGHWHRRVTNLIEGVRFNGEEYDCQVIGLDCDGSNGNVWFASWEGLRKPTSQHDTTMTTP